MTTVPSRVSNTTPLAAALAGLGLLLFAIWVTISGFNLALSIQQLGMTAIWISWVVFGYVAAAAAFAHALGMQSATRKLLALAVLTALVSAVLMVVKFLL